ncbi:PucR family transcriptional regulator [Flavonifractor porci]|uniref:PucR family transcriptional regulator n=1 Tax=Flavonifractor porci TaxID=3133422 RepID=UPI0030B188B5
MEQTLKDIMEMNGFRTAKVIAGKRGLWHPVHSAALMEVPDIVPYVEENCLLLTTLYPIVDDQMKIKTLISQLSSKRVAGICIKPLRYIKDIPQIMLEQAETYDFPVIELAEDANLSALANLILSVTLNDQVEQMRLCDQVQRSLMEQILSGAQVDRMVLKLAEILDREVVLLNREYLNICSVRRGENGAWTVLEGPGTEKETIHSRHITCPVEAGNAQFGYLLIPSQPKEDAMLRVSAKQAAAHFASIFYKNDMALLQEKNFRDLFLQELLQGKILMRTEMESKMRAFALPLHFPMRVTVIELLGANEIQRKRFYGTLLEQKIVEKHPLCVGRGQRLVIYYQDTLVALEASAPDEQMLHTYETLQEKLTEQWNRKIRTGIGISQPAADFQEIEKAYQQALCVVKLDTTLYQTSFTKTYAQNQLLELIDKIRDTQLLAEYVKDRLGKVIAYDQQNSSRLMETLHALIRSNFNFKKAAEISFVHHNTIRYRANKMLQLGLSFEPGQDLAELILAYNIYLWLKAQKAPEGN